MSDSSPREQDTPWPPLPLADWARTYRTLHLWSQLVGKALLALAPFQNHWWHVTFHVTARGLSTPAVPCGGTLVEMEFDLCDHVLRIRTSDGRAGEITLRSGTTAEFFREFRDLLDQVGCRAPIWPVPVEIADETSPFPEDTRPRDYDRESANRFWRVLVQVEGVLRRFRSFFTGKASPVHFFWGSFDLALTFFSGRRAPVHPGGVPNLADWVTREAYSREVWSGGWWPGGGPVPEPAFYAYAYPAPEGFASAPVRPHPAFYDQVLREFILPYGAVRTSADPEQLVLEFLRSTYEAAANLGRWDRPLLERGSS